MKKNNKTKSKNSSARTPHPREFGETVDLGVESEKRWSARHSAAAFGFDNLPIGNRIDLQSDLNRILNHETVDSISGDDAVTGAEEISDFDTITDSNTLISASVIAGAFPTEKGDKNKSRDGAEEDLKMIDMDSISNKKDGSLGLVDESDAATIEKYIRANKKSKLKREQSRQQKSHEAHV